MPFKYSYMQKSWILDVDTFMHEFPHVQTQNVGKSSPESDELASTMGRSLFNSFFERPNSSHFNNPSRAFILSNANSNLNTVNNGADQLND